MEWIDTLQSLYVEFETMDKQKKEIQLRLKELKNEMTHVMEENGTDNVVVDGLDLPVRLVLEIVERNVLNKKGLAEELQVSQRELSKPQTIISLTKDGKLSEDMIERYTAPVERQVFAVKDALEGEDE